jgi:hypothetical protein
MWKHGVERWKIRALRIPVLRFVLIHAWLVVPTARRTLRTALALLPTIETELLQLVDIALITFILGLAYHLIASDP